MKKLLSLCLAFVLCIAYVSIVNATSQADDGAEVVFGGDDYGEKPSVESINQLIKNTLTQHPKIKLGDYFNTPLDMFRYAKKHRFYIVIGRFKLLKVFRQDNTYSIGFATQTLSFDPDLDENDVNNIMTYKALIEIEHDYLYQPNDIVKQYHNIFASFENGKWEVLNFLSPMVPMWSFKEHLTPIKLSELMENYKNTPFETNLEELLEPLTQGYLNSRNDNAFVIYDVWSDFKYGVILSHD